MKSKDSFLMERRRTKKRYYYIFMGVLLIFLSAEWIMFLIERPAYISSKTSLIAREQFTENKTTLLSGATDMSQVWLQQAKKITDSMFITLTDISTLIPKKITENTYELLTAPIPMGAKTRIPLQQFSPFTALILWHPHFLTVAENEVSFYALHQLSEEQVVAVPVQLFSGMKNTTNEEEG